MTRWVFHLIFLSSCLTQHTLHAILKNLNLKASPPSPSDLLKRLLLICLSDATYGLIVGVPLELKIVYWISRFPLNSNSIATALFIRTLRRDDCNSVGGHKRRMVADSSGGDTHPDWRRWSPRIEEGSARDYCYSRLRHFRERGDQTYPGLGPSSFDDDYLQHFVPCLGMEKVEDMHRPLIITIAPDDEPVLFNSCSASWDCLDFGE